MNADQIMMWGALIGGYCLVAVITGIFVKIIYIKKNWKMDDSPAPFFTIATWPIGLPIFLCWMAIHFIPGKIVKYLEKREEKEMDPDNENAAISLELSIGDEDDEDDIDDYDDEYYDLDDDLGDEDEDLDFDITEGDYRNAPKCRSCGQRVVNL
jgi:hypothetical protein